MELIVNELHANTRNLVDHAKHLQKLDVLTDIKESLLGAAVGRDQIPVSVATKILYVLASVILALCFVIVFLLTGHKMGFVSLAPPVKAEIVTAD